jgi:hypothetical protein
MRAEGAVYGALCGPSIGYGVVYSGIGDGRWPVWVLATAIAAILGAAVWPVFHRAARGADETWDPARDAWRPSGPGFAALFGFCVGMIGGAFAGFPMGSVFGALGGAVGGAVCALVGRAHDWLGGRGRALALGGLAGAAAAFLVLYVWSR